ncbi:GNAT family N-acetyltransferase [uncultured Croceitalea sp.]|uniref:GNAT family N-acetyltransferase n=1 Tax=uncultured Croceitalea sp. TaxID=1798908 RepID=UPI003305704F
MEFKTLAGVDKKEILEVFNTSFSDYFIPFRLSYEQLDAKMLADKTDLSLSVGVFENTELIGFILHGFDTIDNKRIVYNGGTGVIPKKRGQGLTKRMYQFMLNQLKKKQIDNIVLEVIAENIQAIKSYQASGFAMTRRLVCYKGDVKPKITNREIDVQLLNDYDWKVMESFWDIRPTWQNSKNVVDQLKYETFSLGAYVNKQFAGYVIFNPTNNRIHQIAVNKYFRNFGIGATLISEISNKYEGRLSIINVDKKSRSIHPFLKKIGFKVSLEQLEMELKLS